VVTKRGKYNKTTTPKLPLCPIHHSQPAYEEMPPHLKPEKASKAIKRAPIRYEWTQCNINLGKQGLVGSIVSKINIRSANGSGTHSHNKMKPKTWTSTHSTHDIVPLE
jgi:hypothetical protein